VTDDHILNAAFFEHLRRDFPGERAVFRPVDVLRADFDVGAGGGFNRCGYRGERRTDHDFNRCDVFYFGLEFFNQGFRFGRGLVHLPVAGNDYFSRHFNNTPYLYRI
jgi:hypothetical protein